MNNALNRIWVEGVHVDRADTRFGAQATDATYDEWGRRDQLGFNMEF
jgi:hypothetical protein